MAQELAIIIKARDEASGVLKDVDKHAGGLGDTLRSVGTIAGGFLAATVISGGVQKLTGFVGESVAAIKDSIQVNAQLDAVLKSTGGAAGLTAIEIRGMAGALEKVSLFEDEAILHGQNLLLTFTGIGKDTFPRATQSMLDMAQALGTDASGAAIQLGKALNNPMEGITALTRVGVSFTEEQKGQIKAMQEAGDVAGAQAIILAELEKEFGGSAKAASDAAGKTEVYKDKMNDLKETIGEKMLPVQQKLMEMKLELVDIIVTKVIPAISELADWIKLHLVPALKEYLIPAWETLQPVLESVIRLLQPVGQFLADHKPLLIALAGAILLLVAPWLAVIAAIVLVLAKWDDIKAMFTETIPGAIDSVITKIKELPIIGEIFQAAFDAARIVVETVFEIIKTVVDTAIKAVRDIINIVTALIRGDWDEVWNGIKQLVSDIWDGIKEIIDLAIKAVKDLLKVEIDLIKGILGDAWDLVKGKVEEVWTGIKDFVSDRIDDVVGFFEALPGRVVGALSSLASSLKEAIEDVVAASKDFVSDRIDDVVGFFARLPGRIVTALGDLGNLLFDVGHSILMGLWDGMKSAWNDTAGWLGGLAGKILNLKGPASADAVLLYNQGQLIIGGLAAGMQNKWDASKGVLTGITADIVNLMQQGMTVTDAAAGDWAKAMIKAMTGGLKAGEPVLVGAVEAMTAKVLSLMKLGMTVTGAAAAQWALDMIKAMGGGGAAAWSEPSDPNLKKQGAAPVGEPTFWSGKVAEVMKQGMTVTGAQAGDWAQTMIKLMGAGQAVGLQHGGIVTRPTLAMIGEAGPEAVVPLGRGGGMGAPITINVNINAIDGASVERIAPELTRRIDRHLKGLGKAGLV